DEDKVTFAGAKIFLQAGLWHIVGIHSVSFLVAERETANLIPAFVTDNGEFALYFGVKCGPFVDMSQQSERHNKKQSQKRKEPQSSGANGSRL
ncbi:MAG: hypothetical protein NC311_09645, partial [Muribaculaceae bacterium]|nr:hypothetical protein [Muribaculaceae bacterium]